MASNYFQHQQLVKRTKLIATKIAPKNLRLFDRHVGLFYAKRAGGGVISYDPIKINKPGMADVYGIFYIERNDGFKIPIHIEIEFKTGSGKLTEKQENWKAFCENMGILYFLVRDENWFASEFKKRVEELICKIQC